MNWKLLITNILLIQAVFLNVGCSPSGNDDDDDDVASQTSVATETSGDTPATYEYASRFADGESSVAYSGQTFRHLLVEAVKVWLGELTAQIDGGSLNPTSGDVKDALNAYYQFDSSVSGDSSLPVTTDPSTTQSTFNDVSSDKDLQEKIAGNDATGQHKDWSSDFKGWDASDATTPDALVQFFFDQVDQMATARAQGTVANDPDGNAITKVFVSESGRDYQQLIQKFLLMSVAFSQGVDDYLDDDTEGKGLLTDNVQDGEKAYSKLEHQWDEGFGYFGAARDFNDYTDDEIAAKDGREDYQGYHDSDADGTIDLRSEYNFGNAVNAAKRDRGSSSDASTDYTKATFDAFLEGRMILSQAEGDLSDEQMNALKAQRDIIVENWEKAVSATVVHYINSVLQDMSKFGTDDYSFLDHAKHWSELKGFALGLQFSRFSPLSDDDFETFHTKVADQPVLSTAGDTAISDYKQALLDARDLLKDAYGFSDLNMGDDNGENGW